MSPPPGSPTGARGSRAWASLSLEPAARAGKASVHLASDRAQLECLPGNRILRGAADRLRFEGHGILPETRRATVFAVHRPQGSLVHGRTPQLVDSIHDFAHISSPSLIP